MAGPAEQLTLKARTQHGDDYEVTLPATATGQDLEERVRQALGSEKTAGKRLRLIFQGKLLDPGRALASYNVFNNAFVHVAISELPSAPPPEAQPTQREDGASEEAGGTAGRDEAGSGFDRLRLYGLSNEQIEALRMTYYPEIRELDSQLPQVPGEDGVSRLRRIESQWMAGQPPNSEFAINVGAIMSLSQLRQAGRRQGLPDLEMGSPHTGTGQMDRSPRWGNSRDFLCGFSLGMVLGYISLFFLLERSFTPMHRVGLVMGLTTHFVTRAFTAHVGSDGGGGGSDQP